MQITCMSFPYISIVTQTLVLGLSQMTNLLDFVESDLILKTSLCASFMQPSTVSMAASESGPCLLRPSTSF